MVQLDDFRPGDRVEWNTAQGTTSGKVKRMLTERTQVKGHQVAASKDDPQYLVLSDSSGEEAAHKPTSLRRRR